MNFATHTQKYEEEMNSLPNILAKSKVHVSMRVSSRQGPEYLIPSLCLWDRSMGRGLSQGQRPCPQSGVI